MTNTTLDPQSVVRDFQGTWRLDPAGSSAEFHVKHFWGAITVHGRFHTLDGEGSVAPDGTITGAIRLDAKSLHTKQKTRDQHLRSAEFFDVENHPFLTVTVERLTPATGGRFIGQVRLEAAGQSQIINPTIEVAEARPDAVTLRGEVTVDRTQFGMTWSPLGIAARSARGVITARFNRAQ
jgi:polyisoprenoid-binding protein YceI